MATYPAPTYYSSSCVTEKVPYTTSVPYETTYTTYVDVVTTPPPYYSTSTYTSCPNTYSCYTSYYSTPAPGKFLAYLIYLKSLTQSGCSSLPFNDPRLFYVHQFNLYAECYIFLHDILSLPIPNLQLILDLVSTIYSII